MLFVIDIGNSSIHYGIMDSPVSVLKNFRSQLDEKRTSDEYESIIRDQFKMKEIDTQAITGVIISSVVTQVERELMLACNGLFKTQALSIKPGIKTGLNILLEDPAELGADLICAAVGAISEYGVPTVIVDLGTATTFSYIDANKNFLGGMIMPGIKTGHDALIKSASKVNEVVFESPKQLICRNTDTAIQAGLIFGHAAMIDELIKRIEKEHQTKVDVMLTGGLAPTIIKHLQTKYIYDPFLIFKGLYLIYQKNIKK